MKKITDILIHNKLVLLGIAFLLCALGSKICELAYGGYIDYWDHVYKFKEGHVCYFNPYIVEWHSLKYKLYATERLCGAALIFSFIDRSWWKLLSFVYLLFALQNFIGRVIFNETTMNILDKAFIIWLIYYIYKNRKNFLSLRKK